MKPLAFIVVATFVFLEATPSFADTTCDQLFRVSLFPTVRELLSDDEIRKIQQVCDKTGVTIYVVGSAVRGERRGRETSLPLGKKEGEKSDIDYMVSAQDWHVFEVGPFAKKSDCPQYELPDYDEFQGILKGYPDRRTPSIVFKPKQPPRYRLPTALWLGLSN